MEKSNRSEGVFGREKPKLSFEQNVAGLSEKQVAINQAQNAFQLFLNFGENPGYPIDGKVMLLSLLDKCEQDEFLLSDLLVNYEDVLMDGETALVCYLDYKSIELSIFAAKAVVSIKNGKIINKTQQPAYLSSLLKNFQKILTESQPNFYLPHNKSEIEKIERNFSYTKKRVSEVVQAKLN